jgi:hypothetical protein
MPYTINEGIRRLGSSYGPKTEYSRRVTAGIFRDCAR